MKTRALIFVLVALSLAASACSARRDPVARTTHLPETHRVGVICRRTHTSRLPQPESRSEAARNGAVFGSYPAEDPHGGGIIALATMPTFALFAAAQGVSAKDRLAAIPVVERAAGSANWKGLFEHELDRAIKERTGRTIANAAVPATGLFHPAWKARHDVVLAIDFNDPSLRGRDGINPMLWAETSVYWSLIDTRTGRAIAGGPASESANDGHEYLCWAADGGISLRRAFAEATRLTAENVASAAFPARDTTAARR